MISVVDLHMHFGGIRAVDGVSLSIDGGRITGLIGPNGAGKTTLFNVIAGVYRPTSGSVYLAGEDVTGFKPHKLCAMGMLRTFQIAQEFPTLTLRENLMMAPSGQSGENLLDAWLRPALVRSEEERVRAKADEVIEFLELTHVAHELAGNLSGGQKKLLELGRTMMADAKVVLLDEVGAGVNRTLLKTLGDAILRLQRERGYTFCMIEHDMDFISRLCERVIVMVEGAVFADGTVEEVKDDERVGEAYLGARRKSKPDRTDE